MRVRSYEVLSDTRLNEGGFLVLRRMKLRAVLDDGSKTKEGTYEFVERPKGLDAVVLAIWTRGPDGRARVLLRDGVRIPLVFGRTAPPKPLKFTEVVAGILEKGEETDSGIRQRAADEAWEEAGLRIAPDRVKTLGPATFPTPGMCAEYFHLMECEISKQEADAAEHPSGDGSPFEEGAAVRWSTLDEALAAVERGEINDLKTEVILRRLQQRLA